jgi:hypothetical protein
MFVLIELPQAFGLATTANDRLPEGVLLHLPLGSWIDIRCYHSHPGDLAGRQICGAIFVQKIERLLGFSGACLNRIRIQQITDVRLRNQHQNQPYMTPARHRRIRMADTSR